MADDVVFAEIVAELQLDDVQRIGSEVFEPVDRAAPNVDRFRAHEIDHPLARRHGGGAGDHRPVLAALLVTLERQAPAGIDDEALHLEASTLLEHMERAPGALFAVDHGRLHRLSQVRSPAKAVGRGSCRRPSRQSCWSRHWYWTRR